MGTIQGQRERQSSGFWKAQRLCRRLTVLPVPVVLLSVILVPAFSMQLLAHLRILVLVTNESLAEKSHELCALRPREYVLLLDPLIHHRPLDR